MKHQEQIIKRSFKREISGYEIKLEKRIYVREMSDAEINTMAKVDVPENPFKVVECKKVETADFVETTKSDMLLKILNMERISDKVSHEETTDVKVNSAWNVKGQQEALKVKFLVNRLEYELLGIEEKVELFDIATLPEEFDNLVYTDKAVLFNFGDLEYSIGVKVYKDVLERLEIKKDFDEV